MLNLVNVYRGLWSWRVDFVMGQNDDGYMSFRRERKNKERTKWDILILLGTFRECSG